MRGNWGKVTIGDEINLLNGFPFNSSKFNENQEGMPLIRIRDLLKSSQKTYFNGPFAETYVINEDDILVGMDGDFHIVRWKNSESLLNQRILKISQKANSNIDVDFLYYFLQPFLLDIHAKTAATTVKHLSSYDILNAVVKFPQIPQQKKIAQILSTCDAVLEQTEAAIAKYQALKQGMLHDLFTRGIDLATGQLRPKYEDAPELYKETELGFVPREWEVVTIGDVFDNLDGQRIPIKKEDREFMVGNIPYYGASGIIDYVNDFIFDEQLILLGEDGENVVSRNSPLAFKVKGKTWINNHAHVLRPKNNYDIDFLVDLLESLDYSNIVSGSAQPKINQANLNKKLISLPKLDEQLFSKKRILGLNKKIQAEQQTFAKYTQLKAGLMQDLLSGAIGVENLIED